MSRIMQASAGAILDAALPLNERPLRAGVVIFLFIAWPADKIRVRSHETIRRAVFLGAAILTLGLVAA